jgi:hypothetical protein
MAQETGRMKYLVFVLVFWGAAFSCFAQAAASGRPLVQMYVGTTFSLVADLDRHEFIALQHTKAPDIAPEGRLRIVQNTPGILIVGDEGARYYVFTLHPKNEGDIPVYGITYFSGPDIEALLLSDNPKGGKTLQTAFLTSLDLPDKGVITLGCGCLPADSQVPCSSGGDGAFECGQLQEKNTRKNRQGKACTVNCNAGYKACCNLK